MVRSFSGGAKGGGGGRSSSRFRGLSQLTLSISRSVSECTPLLAFLVFVMLAGYYQHHKEQEHFLRAMGSGFPVDSRRGASSSSFSFLASGERKSSLFTEGFFSKKKQIDGKGTGQIPSAQLSSHIPSSLFEDAEVFVDRVIDGDTFSGWYVEADDYESHPFILASMRGKETTATERQQERRGSGQRSSQEGQTPTSSSTLSTIEGTSTPLVNSTNTKLFINKDNVLVHSSQRTAQSRRTPSMYVDEYRPRRRPIKFKLRGIDAPELRQEGGKEAKEALETLLRRGRLLCKTKHQLEEEKEEERKTRARTVLLPVELRPNPFPVCYDKTSGRSILSTSSSTPFNVVVVAWDRDPSGGVVLVDVFLSFSIFSGANHLVLVQEQMVRAGHAWSTAVSDASPAVSAARAAIARRDMEAAVGLLEGSSLLFEEAEARGEGIGLWASGEGLSQEGEGEKGNFENVDDSTAESEGGDYGNRKGDNKKVKKKGKGKGDQSNKKRSETDSQKSTTEQSESSKEPKLRLRPLYRNFRYDPVGRLLDGWSPEDGPMPPWVFRRLEGVGKAEFVLGGEYFMREKKRQRAAEEASRVKGQKRHRNGRKNSVDSDEEGARDREGVSFSRKKSRTGGRR